MIYLVELAAWPVSVAAGVLAWHLYMAGAWRVVRHLAK